MLAQRKLLPRIGGRKTYYLITPHLVLNDIKFGRDKLFRLLRDNDLLIKPRRRYVQTTNSKHWLRKYPNIAKELKLTAPEQLWVSDVTYLKQKKEIAISQWLQMHIQERLWVIQLPIIWKPRV